MSAKNEALSAFIQGAPPGELSNVTAAIKTLTPASISSSPSLDQAYKTYNESQLTTVLLPGSSTTSVLISPHNALDDGRYFDPATASSFEFDQRSGKASAVTSYVLEGEHVDLGKSITKALDTHTNEHFASSTSGVFPSKDGDGIAILIVANKYSPSNFWNGRWRSQYIFNPSTSSLTGTINVDVHYYEDGNVRLLTVRPVSVNVSSGSAMDVVKAIATAERKYQEELNRGLAALNEGAFKGLRRQLPVTRQKMDWEKVSSYRVGQDIGGSRGK